jgi:YVTN family beta-propeller protein
VPVVRLIFLLAFLLAPTASWAADSIVHLYLQPLPAGASRLSFVIGSITAVTASGAEHPLMLHLADVDSTTAGRQRLLATGRLPAGRYVGFALRITKATLTRDGGLADLAVPDTAMAVDLPFSSGDQGAWLAWLTLRHEESIAEGYAFKPAFSAFTPTLPVTDTLGFVTSRTWNVITVFDKRRAEVVAVIDTCDGPAGLTLDQRARRLYVACSRDDEIQAIDIAATSVVQRVSVSPGDQPRELAVTPDGATLVSVNPGSNSVSFFDARSLATEERVEVGAGPQSVLIDAAGRRAFVFSTLSHSISVVDVASRSLVATLSVEAAPLRGTFDERGIRLFVIHERSPFMTVVDPAQLSLVTRARLESEAAAVAFDRVRGLLCLAGRRGTAIEFYEPNALLPLYSMRSPAGVSYLAIDAQDSRLYLVRPDGRTLVVGQLADRKLVAEIDVGPDSYWVSVMGER